VTATDRRYDGGTRRAERWLSDLHDLGDGDADGQRDLWGSWNDVIASVANYLAVHGWRPGEPVTAAATATERMKRP